MTPSTPYLAVDVEKLDANLIRIADAAGSAGLDLRPHAKTHKCLEIAARQMATGATGLTVATIGEAEVFATHADQTGCRDLFIAYPLWVSAGKGERLRALAQQVSLRLAVDSVAGARQLAAEVGDLPVEVLVEVDSGQHRTGVAPESAGEIAAAATELGLTVIGVFTFPGHGYGPGEARPSAADDEVRALATAAESLRAAGIEPRVRSGGSTPTIAFADDAVLTEIRPGVYPFYDAQQVELGSATFDDVALWAVTTVVHRTGSRVAVDAGSKILGADRPTWTSGFGRLPDHPDARVTSLSEHHAVIDFPDGTPADTIPDPGAQIRLIPNHVCTAVNLVDELHAFTSPGDTPGSGGLGTWQVAARGANT